MVNHDNKGYLLTTNFYKGKNDSTPLVPNKKNMEGKASVQPEGTKVSKKRTNNNQTTRNADNSRKQDPRESRPPKEDRMCATNNHLHYSAKAIVKVF